MAGKKQQKRVKIHLVEGSGVPKNPVENYANAVVFIVEAGESAITARDRKEIEDKIKETLKKQGHEVVRPNAKLAQEVAKATA
jgi:hypothetical protein